MATESYASRAQRRFGRIVDFVDKCQTNFKKTLSGSACATNSTNEYCEWSDTVTIKLNASDHSDNEYTDKFGVNFLDEDTLIIGDEMNNVLLVYQNEDKVVTRNVTSLIHVLNKLCLTPHCIVHKEKEPAEVPPHNPTTRGEWG